MLFALGAVPSSQLLEKWDAIRVEKTAIGGCILLPVFCMCFLRFDVQCHVMIVRSREVSVIKLSNAQGTSDGIAFLTPGLVF